MTKPMQGQPPGGGRAAPAGGRAGQPASGAAASPSGAHERASWPAALISVLLALAVWIVFGQTVRFEFVNYDDPEYVYENPSVTQGLSLKGVVWAFTHFNVEEWWPLTTLSHMLDCELYGLNPGGHHLTNVVLHAATAILLFGVLRRMTGALWPSAFVAAVFAIHPLRVESVAWVTERKDVLSGLFFMLTLHAYVRHARKAEAKRHRSDVRCPAVGSRRFASSDYWLALLFFTLGLLAKSMVVTLPGVLLLLDYWPLRRWTPGSQRPPADARLVWGLIREKIPFLVLAAVSSLVTVLAIEDLRSGGALGLPWRIGNALVAYATYLGQMIYPVRLAVLYPHPTDQLPVWQVAISALVLLFISAVALAGWRKRPYLAVGWLWYVGMLVPVIGLLQVGGQARADRYTYLPQIGIYILLAWGAREACRNWRQARMLLPAAAAAVLAAFMVAARAQTAHWRDSVSLWTHTLSCTTGNFSAHYNLGMELAAQGRRREAIEQYELALRLRPDNVKALNNLGIALAGEGRLTEALPHWQRALQLKPDDAEANNNLANALAAQRRWTEAIPQYQRAIQRKPHDPKLHYNLGLACAASGNRTEAVQHYRRALELQPDFAAAHNNLGIVLADQAAWAEAQQHYERALQLKPDYAEAHHNWGVALAAQGRLPEAVQHFQRALTLAEAQGNAALAQAIRAQLDSYRATPPPR